MTRETGVTSSHLGAASDCAGFRKGIVEAYLKVLPSNEETRRAFKTRAARLEPRVKTSVPYALKRTTERMIALYTAK